MPVDLITTSRKFHTRYKNADIFASNPSDFTTNLAGCVGEGLKVTSEVQVSWYFQCSASNPVDWEHVTGFLFRVKKQTGQNWTIDGFSENDIVEVDLDGTITTGTLTTLTPTWMYLDFPSSPFTGISGVITTVLFNGQTPLTALIYRFGLVDNDDSYTPISFLTNNAQSYYASDLIVSTPQNMLVQGVYSDWVSGSATCEKLVSADPNVQKFEITHIFDVPYYRDGELPNIQDNVIPGWLAGLASLKYTCKYEFRTDISNPNTKKEGVDEDNLGSVGWFNENFNGFQNDYAVESVTYEDSGGNSADGLLIDSSTVVKITISKISGAFVATDKIGLLVSYLPDITEYQNTLTTFDDNFMYEIVYRLADGVANNGAIISNIEAEVISGDILITATIDYSSAQQMTLAAKVDPYFLLAVNVGDITKTNANSDRVMLLIDAEKYDSSPDIPDLITLNDFRHFSHDETIGVDAGTTDFIGWNEDGLSCTFDFDIDLNKAAFINTLGVKLIAYNTVTDSYFELDNYEFDVSSTVVSAGVQQLNLNDTRGYILASGSQFNDVSIIVGANVAGIQTYTGTFSQKISWQTWIQNINADTVFYDSTEPLDNLNNKASNYSMLNDYEIKIALFTNIYGENPALGISGNTDYLMLAGNISTYDYDLDWNPSPEWTATIETWDESEANNLGGEILTNGDNTLVKTTFVNNYAPIYDITDFWSIHKAQIQNGFYNNEELSSLILPPTNQLPIPIPPATLLDMSIVGVDIVTKSLIDGSLLDPNENYRISSRVQSPNAQAAQKTFWFYTEYVTPSTIVMSVTNIGTACDWSWGDGGTDTADNSVSHVFALPGTKLSGMMFDNYSDITGIDFNGNTDLRTSFGTIPAIMDLSVFTGLTSIRLHDNSGLTAISFPTSATGITDILIQNCDLTGVLDISGLSGFGGGIAAFNNPNLTSVLNPISSQVITGYNISACDLTGAIDISGLSNLSGLFDVFDNVNLTGISNPASSQMFDAYRAYNCDLGYIDFTTMPNMMDVDSAVIDLTDNNMTATEVNHILVDLNSITDGLYSFRQVLIAGTNAAPDGSSGGYDGLTAKASLQSKFITVLTN